MRLYIPSRSAAGCNSSATVSPLLQLYRELDQLFASQGETQAAPAGYVPPLDLSESEQNVQVRVDLPGLTREQIKLSLQEDVLTISGERPAETLETGAGYHRRERVQGRFERTIRLGLPVDASKITATFKDGVLVVTLPKTQEAKPRQIDIASN
jgi:HSP20 family protein